jgi:hypothetical protein
MAEISGPEPPVIPSTSEKDILLAELNRKRRQLEARVINLENVITKMKTPGKIELAMDKVTSTGLALLFIVLIVGAAFISAYVLGGLEAAQEIWDTLDTFITIIAVYFGFEVAKARYNNKGDKN